MAELEKKIEFAKHLAKGVAVVYLGASAVELAACAEPPDNDQIVLDCSVETSNISRQITLNNVVQPYDLLIDGQRRAVISIYPTHSDQKVTVGDQVTLVPYTSLKDGQVISINLIDNHTLTMKLLGSEQMDITASC